MAGDEHRSALAVFKPRRLPDAAPSLEAQIERLQARIEVLEREKMDMIDNFRVTTSVLLERIKTLESEELTSRPSTSVVMERAGAARPRSETTPEILCLQPDADEDTCGNCGKAVPAANLASHTVHCYRYFSRCQACNDLIPLALGEQHHEEWTSTEKWATAVRSADFSLMGLIVAHGLSVDAEVGDDHILHVGARCDNVEYITFAVSRGSDVDPVNSAGDRPLHIAASVGAALFVRYLVELGADFDACNGKGETALHLAARQGHAKVAGYLVQQGANVEFVNRLGDTPIQVAQRNGHLETVLAMGQTGASLRPGTPLLREAQNVMLRPRKCELQVGATPDHISA
jgi:hypothetical protein